jgi:hypothetical protein
MNPQETKLKQDVQMEIRLFKAQLAQLLSDLVDLEGDIEWHFDKYNESVGNPEEDTECP